MKIQIKLLSDNATLPIYATAGAAGCDIFASEDFTIEPTQVVAEMSENVEVDLYSSLVGVVSALANDEPKLDFQIKELVTDLTSAIKSAIQDTTYKFELGRKVVDTGVAFGIPVGSNIELELRSKSGLAFKKTTLSFNGTLDEDFENELKVLMFNLTSEPIHFKKGEKVAQGVFKQIIQANFEEVENFDSREVVVNLDRENNESVIKDIRTDGFGSTGTTKDGAVKLS